MEYDITAKTRLGRRGLVMKRIEAVISQDTLASVKLALAATKHSSLTICDMKEQDTHGSITLRYRSESQAFDMLPRVSLAVLVEDADARAAVDAIVRAAEASHERDATVVVVPVDEIIRISAAAVA